MKHLLVFTALVLCRHAGIADTPICSHGWIDNATIKQRLCEKKQNRRDAKQLHEGRVFVHWCDRVGALHPTPLLGQCFKDRFFLMESRL